MSKPYVSKKEYDDPTLYAIRIKGHLDDRWANRFDGLTLTREENGDIVLTGLVVDRAALHGLLRRVRDLGMSLLSVVHVQSEPAQESNSRPQDASPRSTKETQP